MTTLGRRPILGINVPYSHGAQLTARGWRNEALKAESQAKTQAGVLAPLLLQNWGGMGLPQQSPAAPPAAHDEYDRQARRALAGLDSYVKNRATGQVEQWTPALQSQYDSPLQWLNERRFARNYVPMTPQAAQRHFADMANAFRPAPSAPAASLAGAMAIGAAR